MMRPTWTIVLLAVLASPVFFHQAAFSQQAVSPQAKAAAEAYAKRYAEAQLQAERAKNAQPNPGQQGAASGASGQPFPPLNPAQQAQLNQLLLAWQQVSQGTKTLDCGFRRYHFDNFAAPLPHFATAASGTLKYAAPDKGLFQVDKLMFFKGMEEDGKKPKYEEEPGQFGEHWVCNGKQLIEFDRSKKECKIQDLPPEMQGQQIFESPLPFVFNLDAAKIQQRYWVRQVAAPKPGVVLIEAWPKRQDDRAQYKMVQIALDEKTFLPQALIMYAPNFHAKTAPKWDHYEFTDMKRNGVGNAIASFMQNFIKDRPPADWKVFHDKYTPPQEQQATRPDGTQLR